MLTGVAAVGAGLVAGSARVPMAAPPGGGAGSRPTTPESALRELVAGNGRWRTYHERHPDQTRTVRRTLVAGQHPFAVVLGCVDSRVPPELVFDQGLGDLLTVRSAGEVLDEAVLGSIAYGVLELRIPLVVILGHQSCGAVAAAVRAAEGGPLLPGHMQYLVDQIRPAIDRGLRGPRGSTPRSPRTYGWCGGGWPRSPRWPQGSPPGRWPSWAPGTNSPASACAWCTERTPAYETPFVSPVRTRPHVRVIVPRRGGFQRSRPPEAGRVDS